MPPRTPEHSTPTAFFFEGPLCLYQARGDDSKIWWIVSTQDYVLARLQGPVVACAEIAERILQLTDWEATNEAAKRGDEPPEGLGERVENAIFADMERVFAIPVGPRAAEVELLHEAA